MCFVSGGFESGVRKSKKANPRSGLPQVESVRANSVILLVRAAEAQT